MNEEKVVRLVTLPELNTEITNSNVAELLEEFLGRAKEGEYKTLAIVACTYDGEIHKAWTEVDGVLMFLGALEALKVSLLRNSGHGD